MLKYYGSDPNFSLEEKTAIMRGVAAGIGRVTADFFAQKELNIIITDMNPSTFIHISITSSFCFRSG